MEQLLLIIAGLLVVQLFALIAMTAAIVIWLQNIYHSLEILAK